MDVIPQQYTSKDIFVVIKVFVELINTNPVAKRITFVTRGVGQRTSQ